MSLEPNLRALRVRSPDVADAIAASPPLETTVEQSQRGVPTICDRVLLHTRHDPVREARVWADSQRERLDEQGAETAVVLGFGLGYHVEALAAAWDGRIVVIEPDRPLLRTAFEARDVSALLARVELLLAPPDDDGIDAWRSIGLLPHGPSLLRAGESLRAPKERIAGRALARSLRLRVLVVSPLAGGSHPIAGSCARALAELGHAVTYLDLAAFAPGMPAIGSFSPDRAARRRLEETYCRFLGEGILAAVDTVQPDLVLALAQAPLVPPILAEIGRRGVRRAFWFVEDHRLFRYWREVAPEYDYLFTIQRGALLEEAAALTGCVRYLPCAADPAVHRPLDLTADERRTFGAPVSFVGAGYRNRRLAFRSLLDLGLRVWGSDWENPGLLEAALQRDGARVSSEDAVRVFNATDVNVNLHSSTYVDGVDPRGDFVNPRTFEIAAAGAFQLVDERALLPEMLHPGREVATFADAGELRDRVAYWLERPDERAAIALAGRRRVLAEHTYRRRMAALVETVCAQDGEAIAARTREETAGTAARAAGETPLGRFLGRLPPATPFTLDAVTQHILDGNGELPQEESIFLLLHQFRELYLGTHA
jgi:spore maturation protein CgeB